MKNLFRFILAFAMLCSARAQNVNGGGTQATTGTVRSVALSAPAFLSVSGSPVTTSGTLALSYSGTALPVANGGTGITSFGTGVATFLGTPSSANLASAVTDETGSGLLVFGTSPTFTTSTTLTSTALATTSADGHVIQNTTASTSGATVQYSPRLRFVGHGWNTTSTAADNYVEMTEELRPTSAATPTGALTWSFRRSTAGSGSFLDFGSIAPDTTSGGVNIAAIGTNQNITLNPSGSGSVISARGFQSTVAAASGVQAFYINSSEPRFVWRNSTGGTNGKIWDIDGDSGNDFSFRVVNDADSAANPWIRASRSGTTISSVTIYTGSGTAALLLDSAQNATVIGTVKSGGFARVTGDVTNATASMSNLTNLSVTVASGAKYVGTIQVFANDSTGTDGLAFDLGGGSATFTDLEFGFAAQPTGSTLGTVTSTTSTTAITLTVVSTSDAVYTISFGFTCNAGGTFIPRFAQNSHSTGTSTVRKNSGTITLASAN